MCISDWSSDVCSSYLLALYEHTNGAVGQLQKLEHGGDHADVVEIVALRIVLAGIELGDEEDFLVAFHRGLERGNRAVAADEQRHEHVRENRSDERRLGTEGVSTCRFRWAPYH